MPSRQFQHAWGDGQQAFVHAWLPSAPPRGCVQIVHGMAEHGTRYARFAAALTAAGFAVYAQDLPGHGRTARTPAELGHFADRNGWRHALAAVAAVRQRIGHEQPGLPLFALGHSMGAFLLQGALRENGAAYAGAIVSGGTADLGALRVVAIALLRLEALLRGRRHPSAIATALSFRQFSRAFAPNRTDFDWLSRDAAEVDRYVADPLCGFACSSSLWLDLLGFGGTLQDRSELARIPRTLPLLIVNGSEDPATAREAGPRSLERLYRAHLADVSLRIYPGARHELLNETCRDEVTAELVGWLESKSLQSPVSGFR